MIISTSIYIYIYIYIYLWSVERNNDIFNTAPLRIKNTFFGNLIYAIYIWNVEKITKIYSPMHLQEQRIKKYFCLVFFCSPTSGFSLFAVHLFIHWRCTTEMFFFILFFPNIKCFPKFQYAENTKYFPTLQLLFNNYFSVWFLNFCIAAG